MNLIDSHAHLSKATFPDLAAVIARARQAGVEHIITVGTELADGAEALELCGQFAGLSCALGIHPHNAGKMAEPGDWGKLEKLLQGPPVVAIGEIGLDYHYDFSEREPQRQVFERQLRLAGKLRKPAVIHCREAFDDCLAIWDATNPGTPVLFHCFSGDWAQAQQVLERGGFLSFAGIITFKNADALQEVARHATPDRILIETDCPYLSPEPLRKIHPNEPALLVHTAAKLASLRGVSLAEIAVLTAANTRAFFRLP